MISSISPAVCSNTRSPSPLPQPKIDPENIYVLTYIGHSYLDMKDFENAKGIIVIFTCNHCPYSVLYEDRIIALDKKYKEKGYHLPSFCLQR